MSHLGKLAGYWTSTLLMWVVEVATRFWGWWQVPDWIIWIWGEFIRWNQKDWKIKWVLEIRMRKGLASIHFSMLSIIYFYWTLSIFHPQNLTYIFMFNTHQYSPLKNNLLFYLNCSQDTTIVLFIIFQKAICNTVLYNLMIEKKLTYYYAFLK